MLCAYLALHSTTGRLKALFWQSFLCSPFIAIWSSTNISTSLYTILTVMLRYRYFSFSYDPQWTYSYFIKEQKVIRIQRCIKYFWEYIVSCYRSFTCSTNSRKVKKTAYFLRNLNLFNCRKISGNVKHSHP